MSGVRIRPAERGDLPRLTEIYNYYVVHTPVTFDIEPYTSSGVSRGSHNSEVLDGIGCWSPSSTEPCWDMRGLRVFVQKRRMIPRSRRPSIARPRRLGRELEAGCTRSYLRY